MSSVDKKSQVIIDLNKILNENDSTEIKQMENEFQSNGWCFVSLPKELIPKRELVWEISKFFRNNYDKKNYSSWSQMYGYSAVNHKEGLKLLTGSHFERFVKKVLVPKAY